MRARTREPPRKTFPRAPKPQPRIRKIPSNPRRFSESSVRRDPDPSSAPLTCPDRSSVRFPKRRRNDYADSDEGLASADVGANSYQVVPHRLSNSQLLPSSPVWLSPSPARWNDDTVLQVDPDRRTVNARKR